MYRSDKTVHGRPPPPVFGPPPPHGAPLSGVLFPQRRPPPPHFPPPCNSFSIAQNTTIALGGSQQVIPPAEVHLQIPHWSSNLLEHSTPDSSEKAGEEFLRCIADNKPLPDYLKINMADDLAEALKSSSFLKEAVKSNHDFQKYKARSRSRSRCRSRGRSRAKSRCRSKSRARSQSRARSKSHVRDKSWTRSRARSRSRTRNRKTSRTRSKSRVRRSRSRSSSDISCGEIKKRKTSHSSSVSSNPTATSLLEGLKMIMSSKALVERLPSLKEAILNTKASDNNSKVPVLDCQSRSLQAAIEKNLLSQENDTLLPHERVGSDFSWLQGQSEEDASVRKAKQLEEEESFLYGNPFTSQSQEVAPLFMSSRNLSDHKQPFPTNLLASASSCLDSMKFEKVKHILKSLGASSDVSEHTGKEECAARHSSDTTAQQDLPALRDLDVQQALESLINATKDKRVKSESLSQTSADEYKASDSEQKEAEKPDRMKKLKSMEKELEDLLKEDGLTFLKPVIGFYCQMCEEFIEDFKSAEKHSIIHNCNNSSSQKLQIDKDGKESVLKWKHHKHSQASGRRDHKEFDERRSSEDQQNCGDNENNGTHEREERVKCYNTDQTGKKSISLREELKKNRMPITAPHGQTPRVPGMGVNVKVSKDLPASNHSSVKAETPERNHKSSQESTESKSKDKTHSSDTSDDDKSPKPKRSKKKKKKKKKKEKKGKRYNS